MNSCKLAVKYADMKTPWVTTVFMHGQQWCSCFYTLLYKQSNCPTHAVETYTCTYTNMQTNSHSQMTDMFSAKRLIKHQFNCQYWDTAIIQQVLFLFLEWKTQNIVKHCRKVLFTWFTFLKAKKYPNGVFCPTEHNKPLIQTFVWNIWLLCLLIWLLLHAFLMFTAFMSLRCNSISTNVC